MILLHVIIAISTVGLAGISLLKPTKLNLNLSYLFTAMTFATGTYLVIISPANLVTTCISGLVFLSVVGAVLYTARQRYLEAS